MGRRKIRNYPNREYYKTLFNDYFTEHADEVIQYTVDKLGFTDVRAMRDEEMTGIWFDCGWVKVSPKDPAMNREWRLDSDYGSTEMIVSPSCYGTQSTNIKLAMVHKALQDLGLEDTFSVSIRLD